MFGLFNGWLITRFRIQPIIATLVLFIAGRGIAQVLTNGNLQVFKTPEFQFIGLGRVLGIPFQVWIMAVIVIVAAWMLQQHRVRPAGAGDRRQRGGRPALGRAGRPRQARWSTASAGCCSGIAGLIVIAINSSSDANLVGLGMELDAIAAVAVGGTLLTGGRATVIGTLLGALIIQLVRYTLLANGVPDAAALVVKAADHRAGRLAAAPGAGMNAPSPMASVYSALASQGVLVALVLLILFGWLRYDYFLGSFNVLSVLRYNSMFALIALGMCFVIMTGGIDLSVGSTAAMASVVSALLSPYGLVPGLLGGVAAGCRGRHRQRPDRDAAGHPALHRHAGDHARRQRHRPAARRQPVGLGLLRHRLHRARPGRPAWASRSRR